MLTCQRCHHSILPLSLRLTADGLSVTALASRVPCPACHRYAGNGCISRAELVGPHQRDGLRPEGHPPLGIRLFTSVTMSGKDETEDRRRLTGAAPGRRTPPGMAGRRAREAGLLGVENIGARVVGDRILSVATNPVSVMPSGAKMRSRRSQIELCRPRLRPDARGHPRPVLPRPCRVRCAEAG